MVILSIKNRGSSNKSRRLKLTTTATYTIDDFTQEDFGYNSDEPESAEAGCEIALFEGQICNVPYDLYDLPDLKEILCLEVWNSCLTEDERLSLSAHLPDLELHEFSLTVKQLLSGESICFGSPLDKFFRGLKGGFYSPQVARMREFLLFLQKRAYYHSLKLYHDCMIEKFSDMARMWSGFGASMSTAERVKIWNNKRHHKPVILVDLNASPVEEEQPSPPPPLNKLKSIDETVKVNLLEKRILLRSPKGVLKIKPKSSKGISPSVIPDLRGKITVDLLGSYSHTGQSWDPHDTWHRVNAISSNSRVSQIGEESVYEKNLLENFGKSEIPPYESNLAKFSDSKLNFPITYKRKKAQRKLELENNMEVKPKI